MLLRIIIAALLLFVLALAWLLKAEMTTSREQQDQLEKLTLRLADKAKRENLELQEKCALQAEKMFRAWGREAEGQSHYNLKLNKCFMTVEIIVTSPPTITISRFLLDAYENREYGRFWWKVRKGQGPDLCALKPLGEKTQSCNSMQEYEAFIARYME